MNKHALKYTAIVKESFAPIKITGTNNKSFTSLTIVRDSVNIVIYFYFLVHLDGGRSITVEKMCQTAKLKGNSKNSKKRLVKNTIESAQLLAYNLQISAVRYHASSMNRDLQYVSAKKIRGKLKSQI